MIGRRFDWFAGRWGKGPINEERKNNLQRGMLAIVMVSIFVLRTRCRLLFWLERKNLFKLIVNYVQGRGATPI